MASFIRPHVSILLLRMAWLRGRIDTPLKLPELYYFKCRCPSISGADALSTACFLINRMPSSVLNWDTPYHLFFPNKPLFPIEPRVFGCTCFVRDVCPHVSKLDPKSLKCIFRGYSRIQKGYRCYCPSLRKYLVSVDVTFLENTHFS